MNVNPVSFGRTIRVNAPLKVAEHVAELVNGKQTKKGESRVQQQLKTLFYDAEHDYGRARAIAPLGKRESVFILTGKESEELGKLIQDKKLQIEAAKKNYGKGEMYEMVKDVENSRFQDLSTLLITEKLEPVVLDVDYSPKKHRIKSINITF